MLNYSNVAYGSTGFTVFFAGLSLYEWGFLIGMMFSILLGSVTLFINWREQRKRTRLLEELVNKTTPQNPSATATATATATAKKVAEIIIKASKDI